MKIKADLHIHTVLSPCGDIEMSPINIVNRAKELKINVLGITDHNSTLNSVVTSKIAEKENIFVLCGAEVTTSEEVHCLCFMPNFDVLSDFQLFLESKVIFFKNNPDKFGYQFVVDEEENIIDEIDYLLINSLNLSINELQKKVEELNGIFIPAHVDKKDTSLSSQLGFIPPDLKFDALELSPFAFKNNFFDKFSWFKGYNYITDSDAHFVQDIGKVFNEFEIEEINFENIKKTIKKGINIENY
ncbi:MAG: PHP domain-containing protein [Bacteroidales bacterium]|jgi:PHP family Zn ribbon phosphoesterase|nr:PHP domain-containing protein [Bacteroidales bacterium]